MNNRNIFVRMLVVLAVAVAIIILVPRAASGQADPDVPPETAPSATPTAQADFQPAVSTTTPGAATSTPLATPQTGSLSFPTLEPTLPPLPLPPDVDPRVGGGQEDEDEEQPDDTPVYQSPVCYAAAERQRNPPRFLSLPFPADPQMEVFHGWRYTHNNQPQCGIDYGKRDASGALTGFPVLAAADGEACADHDGGGGCVSGFGDRVLIRHTVGGETYYTYYGHLEWVEPDIPVGDRSETIRVRRGQVIGFAGDTGTHADLHHLHFGIASPNFGWYDPYDLWEQSVIYPDPLGVNNLRAGVNSFWISNPPASSDRASHVGGPEASLPADALAAGSINLSEWTDILGRESGVVEVWIDGELRGEADFGPATDGDNSTFSWEWDTTEERNGPHTVRLVAFAEDSSIKPLLSATEDQVATFLITVQNPRGFVEQPAPDTYVSGVQTVTGWSTAENSDIRRVEIWINGERRGAARYGLPHAGAGGDYGLEWMWDTTDEPDGLYTLTVRAVAENGGSKALPSVRDSDQATISVIVQNRNAVPKWSIR